MPQLFILKDLEKLRRERPKIKKRQKVCRAVLPQDFPEKTIAENRKKAREIVMKKPGSRVRTRLK
jgi:hypothetical protein